MAALRAVLAESRPAAPGRRPAPRPGHAGRGLRDQHERPPAVRRGRPRDQVLGVSFVTADGALVNGGGRVVKNVAGYDFPRLLTGSMGTLGVITQLTLKVRPSPEAERPGLGPVHERRGPGSRARPHEHLRDPPGGPRRLQPRPAPQAGAALGLPVEDWTLVVGFEDNAASVTWQLDRLMIELGRTNIVIREGADAESLWSALIEFQDAEVGPVSFVANLRPSSVVSFVKDLDPALWALQAHAGNGIVRGHAARVGRVRGHRLAGRAAPRRSRPRRRQPDPVALPDRWRRSGCASGASPAPTGRSPSASNAPSTPRG